MDPDVRLERLLDLARAVHDPRRPVPDDSAEALAELVCDLDTWLAHGGFPPRRWKPRRTGLPTDGRPHRRPA
jgi:hypothetical protein